MLEQAAHIFQRFEFVPPSRADSYFAAAMNRKQHHAEQAFDVYDPLVIFVAESQFDLRCELGSLRRNAEQFVAIQVSFDS